MASEAKLRGNKKHLEKLDDIKVRVPKGQREIITAYVKALDPKLSVNAYIGGLIEVDMQKQKV